MVSSLRDAIERELEDLGSLCLDNPEDRSVLASWLMQKMAGVPPLATFTHPEPPPSANNIYFVRGGRKVLSAQARKWKTIFKATRGGMSVLDLGQIQLNHHSKLFLEVWVYLDQKDIEALSFGRDARVKFPLKKVDTSNFFKLAEDCASDLLGTIACDRQNFKIVGHKKVADHRGSRIVMHLRPYVDEVDPYDPL